MFSRLVKYPGRILTGIIVITLTGLVMVFFSLDHHHGTRKNDRSLVILREAYAAVLQNYVEKSDGKALTLKMVDGMLAP